MFRNNNNTIYKTMKNLCNKTRPETHPYEIWGNSPLMPNWFWFILKKYQTPENEKKNPQARWFCLVKTPIVPDGEYGDVYIHDIKESAQAIKLTKKQIKKQNLL